METISWPHLQYGREKILRSQVEEKIESIEQEINFSTILRQHEEQFFEMMSHALKIDQVESMQQVTNYLNQQFEADIKWNVFMTPSEAPMAGCLPRYTAHGRETKEVIVIVSQHFFNNLSMLEQSCIMGHELGHFLHGHHRIPVNDLLDANLSIDDSATLKRDLVKWRICSEVSCDMMSLFAADFDADTVQKTMIKFSTGLATPGPENANIYRDLLNAVVDQFEQIASSSYESALTTHPLTPLRLRLLKSISDTHLIQDFGKTVEDDVLAAYQKEFDDQISDEIRKVYPEIINAVRDGEAEIIAELCFAVALADGHITDDEVAAIERISTAPEEVQARYKHIVCNYPDRYEAAIDEIIADSLQKVKEQGYSKKEVISILRQLVLIAAEDGTIDRRELEIIHAFGKEFEVSKQDIVIMLGQMGYYKK